jgi:hypothetical protein
LRFNWSLVDSPTLFLPPSETSDAKKSELTANCVGERIWVRVERQTLRRLQESGGILFGIRTYVYPLFRLDAIALHHLAIALQQMPPATQRYKQIEPIQAVVLDYIKVIPFSIFARRLRDRQQNKIDRVDPSLCK